MQLKGTAEVLLSQYVKLRSQKISTLMWKGIDTPNWLRAKEPRGPRSEVVLDEMKNVHQEVTEILPQTAAQGSASSPSSFLRFPSFLG
jgi:hypothetical protein